ncbi:CHY zinc finger protein [Halobacillus litoralis]|uniref:CHY zinc finger protein n=1 Tax=Halobacillus litoralis TaxID=45668 RepID=UPI001CFE2827|nr:CHY zinc finger protein [Halobacillus litoralis]
MKPLIYGNLLDEQTRCVHYHSNIDIIAIKFHCCREYYACYKCHQEKAGHHLSQWPQEEWDEQAIFCGSCKTELTIEKYMEQTSCPNCAHPFNEKCSLHYPVYFDI